jgi:lipopolysaccharide export system protein LptC
VVKARRSRIAIVTLFAAAIAISISTVLSNIQPQEQAIAQQEDETIYRIQETAMSTAAPVAHTGNLPHAVVFALPIRNDSQI